ncbi:MAG: hypothetical protein ABMA14_12730 [Hyphomonadaceae bacterium]
MAQLSMRGVSGRRGPLKPDRDFRVKLTLWFAIAIPAACAIVSLLVVWIGSEGSEAGFLANWLNYTSIIWGIVFGDVAGRRLAAAVGYHRSDMTARVLELIIPLLGYGLLIGIGALFISPRVSVLPAIGAGIFVVMLVVGFVRTMIAK